MADLGFSKGVVSVTRSCDREVESKKQSSTFIISFFFLTNLAFLTFSHIISTAIEYLLLHLDVTVLLESLDLSI